MFRVLCDKLGLDPEKSDYNTFQREDVKRKTSEIAFVTATDGNHGKGVSWASGLFGCRAFVFMPMGSSYDRFIFRFGGR